MSKAPPPTATDLAVPKTARFVRLPKPLSKAAVREIFAKVLDEIGGRPIANEVRVRRGSGDGEYVYSFLCFKIEAPVPFLIASGLTEIRYGFVLLIERRDHLVVLHRGAKGLDDPVAKKSRPVDRRRLTHLHAGAAQYKKLGTRRMTIAKQELRGASYEADDLEIALVPATAARSIVQTIRLATPKHGSVGITPSTGRVRVSASKSGIDQLLDFIDETIDALAVRAESPFLSAFPEPIELDDLPADVVPVGALIDLGALHERLDDPAGPHTIEPPADELLRQLSEVLEVRESDDGWDLVGEPDFLAGRMKRLKSAYGVRFDFPKEYALIDSDGAPEVLRDWLRRNTALSISFSSPEYFYSTGNLYRIAGFKQEVDQVRRFLHAVPALDGASSEKGGPYSPASRHFDDDSIFGVLESTLAADETHVWCGDLGDEWADYIGVTADRLTFYHCKGGDRTTGASAFQIVIGQALKNLSRVKFRYHDVSAKIRQAEERRYWADTRIPLLARRGDTWRTLLRDVERLLGNANASWRVALVVTALSLQDFEKAAAKPTPPPYFIQLIWLLSAFVSGCRERDAQAMVYCRP